MEEKIILRNATTIGTLIYPRALSLQLIETENWQTIPEGKDSRKESRTIVSLIRSSSVSNAALPLSLSLYFSFEFFQDSYLP